MRAPGAAAGAPLWDAPEDAAAPGSKLPGLHPP